MTVDLSPKLTLKSAEQELAREYVVGERPLGESMGGLQMFSNVFKRGYGNKVFGSSEEGIWLGAADFADAPFRVDMEGNAVLTSVTASGYIQVGGAASDVNAGATTISGGKITANTITADRLNVSSLSAISANLGTVTAGTINASQVSITNLNADNITAGTLNVDRINAGSITGGTGGKIASDTITDTNISSLSADKITAGTLIGRTVQSSTGNERIILDNGNYIYFYASGSLKCQLRGTTAGSGGLSMTGDLVLQNNKAVLIASSAGGSSEYGGISITSGNQFWLTLGTNNTFYIKNNAQNDNYFTVSHDRAYHRAEMMVNKVTSNSGDLVLDPEGTNKVKLEGNINMNNYNIDACNKIWLHEELGWYCETYADDPFAVLGSVVKRAKRKGDKFPLKGRWDKLDHSKLHEAVYTQDDTGKPGINLIALIMVQTEAIKQLKQEVEQLKGGKDAR